MSRKACLAIGVGDAPPLTYLGGAVTGAETLGSWALQAGYVTTVLTDRRDPVRLLDVEMALALTYQGQALFDEVDSWIRDRGFRRVGIDQAFWNRETGELLALDGIYAREQLT